MDLRGRLISLENQEERHSSAIKTLEEKNKNMSSQLAEIQRRLQRLEVGAGVVDDRTPIVAPKILNHVALSARETGPFQMNRSDETGAIIHNSLDESLRGITANGDVTLEAVLEVLRRKAFGSLFKWRPNTPMIRSARSKIIRWILHPTNIHKFRSKKVAQTTSRSVSVWTELVPDVFPESRNNQRVTDRIVRILALGARSSDSYFGSFVATVVKAHNSCCTVMHD